MLCPFIVYASLSELSVNLGDVDTRYIGYWTTLAVMNSLKPVK